MPLETAHRYNFRYGGILANAPRASGVYALYRGEELYHIDGSDSIYSALMGHWDQTNGSLSADMPTSFAFERCDSENRHALLVQLVFRCRPTESGRPELKARER
ncbi:MAG TPA: hypothetical protein VMI94_23110 [Bryobacteraceae bacterium]|nr:hypothetical protein [Bryobacteraceae bacterium]